MLTLTSAEACSGQPSAVTIGNFDGVHLGHQALIKACVATARAQNLCAVLLTFNPHPAHVLGRELPAISGLEQRLEIFAALGVDVALLLPFTPELARHNAHSFSQNILQNALCARHVIVGDDFRMGCDHAATPQLQAMGSAHGFTVHSLPLEMLDNEAISSSRIRKALAAGNLPLARAMLDRPYTVRGTVVHGAGRGGPLLGFPTANLDIASLLLPEPGIYASTTRIVRSPAFAGQIYPSVTNIGRNPTFEGQQTSLETFLMNFSGNLYDATLDVSLLQRLRGEKHFASINELKAQIQQDIEARKKYEGFREIPCGTEI